MNIPKTYLTEAIDDKSILRILTQNKQINDTYPKYNYFKKLADWANHRQLKIKNIDLNTIKLSDKRLIGKYLTNQYNSLGSLLNALKNLMDQKGNYDPNNELSKLIQQTTLEVLAELSGIKDAAKTQEDAKETDPEKDFKEDPKEDEKSPRTTGRDWTAEKAKRLANAKANGKTTSEVLNKFYDDYYSIEYAGVESPEKDELGIVTKLKSLDSILVQEFNKLGYSPEVNPLAQFLKILIKLLKENKSDIFNKLTTNTYGAIHNSFIKQYITGNMLGNYNEKNILFCSDLYNYKGLDIVNYLQLQNQTRKQAKTYASEHSHDPEQLVAKILIQQAQPTDNYQNYEEKVDVLLKTDSTTFPGSAEAKLRTAPEISELFRYIFNVAPEPTEKSTKTEDASENKDLKEIVGKAKNEQVMLDMIRYILDQDNFKQAYLDKVADIEEWLKELSYQQNDESIETSKQILSEYTISNKDLGVLVKSLLKAYKKAESDK